MSTSRLEPYSTGNPAFPGTPQPHRTGAAISNLILRLEEQYHLGLQVQTEARSPLTHTGSDAGKVCKEIQRLYWSAEPVLHETIHEFDTLARIRAPEGHLKLLLGLLQSQTPKTPRKFVKEEETKARRFESGSSPAGTFLRRQAINPDLQYTTALESPESGPPSPTSSIKAVHRRHQGSSHTSHDEPGRKRPSEHSASDGSSPKLTRTYKAVQSPSNHELPSAGPPNGFYEESTFNRSMGPPSEPASARASMHKSFESTSASSQSTAATSFDSAADDANAAYRQQTRSHLTRASSAAVHTITCSELKEVSMKLGSHSLPRSRDVARTSSSTFGSIDEQALLDLVIGPDLKVFSSSTKAARTGSYSIPSSDSGSTEASPSGVSYRIRNIPQQNLFIENSPAFPQSYPYTVRFFCHTLASQGNVSIQDLIQAIGDKWVDHDTFRDGIKSDPRTCKTNVQELRAVLQAQSKGLNNYTFRARAVFNNQRSLPVFRLDIQPIQLEDSCRLQRMFGTDRFLYLYFPSFKSSPQALHYSKCELKHIEEQWKEWFMTTHEFLGRKWKAFHIEPIKKSNTKRRSDENFDNRVILFAMEGHGIQSPYSIGQLVDTVIPLQLNGDQSFCKAFSRLDLPLSRTIPTLQFKPSQVHFVHDINADGSPESIQFNDETLEWDETPDEPQSMNDGCSEISVAAMQEVWKVVKRSKDTNDPMPSVIQARLGAAKGMWMLNGESYSKGQAQREISINISEGQRKFIPHQEDLYDDLSSNSNRLTFEVLRWSSPPTPSALHLSFIQILIDRCVPKATVADLIKTHLDMDREALLAILPDPVRLYDWLHKQWPLSRNGGEVFWQAALPLTLGEKIKFLLESGFNPVKAPILARYTSRLIKMMQKYQEKNLRIPLSKATTLYGVADPLGVLSPGEVHVQFSVPFTDAATDETYRNLDGLNVLLARQPALRRSDMQKVRATVHPKLSHLVDVVVFPVRGQYPLAGKLQGGDYDGDRFWICWHSVLVRPFKNAPAPLQKINPHPYRIRKDSRTLSNVMNTADLSTINGFLKEALEFRTKPSLLGIVTIFHEKLAYAQDRINSKSLHDLCDMHDLLVDALKQGYTFTEAAFSYFVKGTLGLKENLRLPAYKAAMEAAESAKEMGDLDRVRDQNWAPKRHHPLDYIYFEVVRKHNDNTVRMVDEILSKNIEEDLDLRYPYLRLKLKMNDTVNKELAALETGIEDVYRRWNHGMAGGKSHTSNSYDFVVDDCYERFRALMPVHAKDPSVEPWLDGYLHQNFSLWETLRASALYTFYPGKHPFVFHMAGRELAALKASSQPGSRSLCKSIHANIKPRPYRTPKEDNGSDDEEALISSTGEDFTTVTKHAS